MVKLSTKGRWWLKSIHITFSVALSGGAVCILLLRLMNWSDGAHRHALDYAALLIEQGIIIPAATGTLVTGFLESWLTNWGLAISMGDHQMDCANCLCCDRDVLAWAVRESDGAIRRGAGG